MNVMELDKKIIEKIDLLQELRKEVSSEEEALEELLAEKTRWIQEHTKRYHTHNTPYGRMTAEYKDILDRWVIFLGDVLVKTVDTEEEAKEYLYRG